MANYNVPVHDESLQMTNFYGTLIPMEDYKKLMQDEDERDAYLDYLRG